MDNSWGEGKCEDTHCREDGFVPHETDADDKECYEVTPDASNCTEQLNFDSNENRVLCPIVLRQGFPIPNNREEANVIPGGLAVKCLVCLWRQFFY